MKTNSLLVLGSMLLAVAVTGCEGPEAEDVIIFETYESENGEPGDGELECKPEDPKDPRDEPPPADGAPPAEDAPAPADAPDADTASWYVCDNQGGGCTPTHQFDEICESLTYSATNNSVRYVYNITTCGAPLATSCDLVCTKTSGSAINWQASQQSGYGSGSYTATCDNNNTYSGSFYY